MYEFEGNSRVNFSEIFFSRAESSSFILAKKSRWSVFYKFSFRFAESSSFLLAKKSRGSVFFFFLQIFFLSCWIVILLALSFTSYISRIFFSFFFTVSVKKNGNSVTTNILCLCIIKPLMDLYFTIWTTGCMYLTYSVSECNW